MKTFAPLVLLALFNVAAARYFPRSARQYDEYIRHLLMEDYGMYRDPAPVKAASESVCQTACEKTQFASREIYTCKTEKHTNDPCSPKGYATNGEQCLTSFPCRERGGFTYTTCYTTSYVAKRCSVY